MYILYFFIIFLNLSLGFVLLAKGKKTFATYCFFIFTIATSFWIFSLFKAWNFSNITFWARMCFVGVTPIPVSFLLFVLNYPKKLIKTTPLNLILVLFIPTLLLILSPTHFIIESVNAQRHATYNIGHKVYIIYYFGYIFLSFIALYRSFQVNKGNDILKVKYISLGWIIFISGSFITNFILPALGTNQYNRIGPLFSSFVIMSTLYAILKYRMMNITLIISRSISSILTITFFGVLYLTFLTLYQKFISTDISTTFILLSMLFITAVGFLFAEVQHHLQSTAEKIFLKKGYDYKKVLLNHSQSLLSCYSLEELIGIINHTFLDEIELKSITILFPKNPNSINKKINIYSPWKNKGSKQVDSIEIPSTLPLVKRLMEEKTILAKEQCSAESAQIFDNFNASLCIPSFSHNHLLSIIFIGSKLSEQTFTEEDYNLFETISNDIAIVYERIQPFEKVKQDYHKSLEMAEQVTQQASYATLTRGIAHEIRNPMGMILSGIEIIVDNLDDKKAIAEYAEVVKENIIRLTKITTSMLKYGSQTRTEKATTSINELIDDILLVGSGELKKRHIHVKKQFGDIPDIYIDPNSMSQAILNIILNGIQAIDEKGNLKISTEKSSFVSKDGKNHDAIKVQITDSGCGISEEVKTKIFDPFFTTKYENTGLGLPMVLNTIHEHNGTLTIESKLNEGTCVIFFLPIN